VAAVSTFIGIAACQVSALKGVCLRNCRSPLGMFLRYASATGCLRDLRVGSRPGIYCLGCCWALFLALIVLGTMNLVVMVTLAAVVALESSRLTASRSREAPRWRAWFRAGRPSDPSSRTVSGVRP
jgi:predicted metal-binding membrane protein